MFGEVDERLPHTVITVMEPVKLNTLRHAALPPGEYKIQGDARNRFRGIRERRLIGTKIDIRFDPGDEEYQRSLHQIVSAQTLSEPAEVASTAHQEPAVTDAPPAAAVEGPVTAPVVPEVAAETAVAPPTPESMTDAEMTEEMRVPKPPVESPMKLEDVKVVEEEKPKKRRGRPKGSKNRPKADKPDEEESKRKRGRPPKELPTVEVPDEAVPRRRSRSRSAI
jgi:hypothetical protein